MAVCDRMARLELERVELRGFVVNDLRSKDDDAKADSDARPLAADRISAGTHFHR
jgi:hypothetical protein